MTGPGNPLYAMQYEITLPADYDMAIIRERISTKAPLLDNLPGLGLKAYLVRERGVDGSPINQYAPFYLWASVAGMGGFLWGGNGFSAIVASFGRPSVRHWTGAACLSGSDRDGVAHTATRLVEPISPDIDPSIAMEGALVGLAERSMMPGVHSAALAVDPSTWEFVHFTLWTRDPPDDAGLRYRVLHLSTPHFDEIAKV